MALAYRAHGTFVAANSTSSGTIGLPAGLTNGDIMVLLVQARGGGTITTPSGYTRAEQINITKGHRFAVYYKYVTNAAGEVGPNVAQSASGLICGRLSAVSGGNATTQLDVAAVTSKHTDLATVTAPSIAPVSTGAMVMWCFSSGDDNTLNAATQGTTAYSSDTTTGADGCIALVYELQTNAGATGTCAMTQSASAPDNWNTITIALRPAAVVTSNPSRDLGFDSITYAMEMAFGSSPFAPDPTWTDISAYVRAADGITITRGRNTEFSDTQTGTMSFTLDNRTRLFDPDYTAGTYYGQLLPMTRVRLRVRKSSVNYPIYDGYVPTFGQGYNYPRESTVKIDAIDLFARLATRKLPASLLSLTVLGDTPYAYFPMNEESGRVASDLSGNGWAGTFAEEVQFSDSFVPGEPQFKSKRLETFSSPFTTSSIIDSVGPAVENLRTLEAWFQLGEITQPSVATTLLQIQAIGTSNGLTVGAIYGAAASGSVFSVIGQAADISFAVAGVIYSALAQNTAYHVAVTIDDTFSTFTLYVNGQVISTADVSASTFEGGSFTTSISSYVGPLTEMFVAHVATYESTLSAAQVLEHYNAGVTGGLLQTAPNRMDQLADFCGLNDVGSYDDGDFTVNTYLGRPDLSGTALNAMQSIMRTEQGRLFVDASGVLQAQGRTADMKDLAANATVQATLSDSGTYAYASPDGVHIQTGTIDIIRNAIYVSAGGGTVPVIDVASRTQFDEREESISAELDDPSAARNLGLSRLRRYKDPTTRIDNVTLLPHGSTDVRYTLCFTVDLGWRLTVTRTPQAIGSAISKTVTVEGITHTLTDGNWVTSLYLVPVNPAYTVQPWFVMGDATYGRLGAAAGNQLSY